jgi:AraC family transcriptional regulator of adaptative response/methylated-DNA-[protein]-cysteine methyltransferase
MPRTNSFPMRTTRRAPAHFITGPIMSTETISVSFAKTSLGLALVAQTTRGVAAILLGDDRDVLRRELGERFPAANFTDAKPNGVVAKVVALIDAPSKRFDAALDLRGTDFQRKVWKALREIPAGSTATYATIAKRIGQPTAYRAVAQACGANPVAVVVPCHRVIRADGGLSGYRWGVERKRALLEREAKA